jgi:hypothetical protein
MKKRLVAITLTIALICACFTLVIFLTDVPLKSVRRSGNNNYGALAIRDHVIPFQQYGTKLFSTGYLKKNYNRISYFTQQSGEDQKEEIISALSQLLNECDSVDIFLLSHTNYYYRWLEELPDMTLLRKVRLVYNTGCSGAMQVNQWRTLGITRYVAHVSRNSISPVFYFYFLRRYCAGQNLTDAITESNIAMHEKLNRFNKISFGLISVDKETEHESEGGLCKAVDDKKTIR